MASRKVRKLTIGDVAGRLLDLLSPFTEQAKLDILITAQVEQCKRMYGDQDHQKRKRPPKRARLPQTEG